MRILALLAILVVGPVAPDPALTPGVVRPLSRAEVCATRWGRDRRHVTPALRRRVFAAYRIPYAKHALYELDHLVPRELGGADDERNLWPEIWSDAHVKDRRENALHGAVCRGELTLERAQAEIRRWGH
jgi:hypothetical protein